jgi:hypothetical protein
VELICGWIEARQAARADPDETAARLLAWMDDDPYGFCYHLEKDASHALDEAGLAALEKQIRARFDAAADARAADGPPGERPEYVRRRGGEALRTIYLAQRSVAAYVALAEQTGLTARDCHAIASLLVTRRKPEEALAWVDRGIALDKKASHGSMAAYDLAKLRRGLLARLGRGEEALEHAWNDYRRNPSKYTYDDLMKLVPKVERTKWRERALEAAEGADLHSRMELLLETKDLQRLANLVRQSTDAALEGVSHHATGPAAKKLEKLHPDASARLWSAQGMRIVNAKKSKYYDAALANFESAKRCYERAGLASDWEKTVCRVRADHHRKAGFMAGFEALIAGSGPSTRPSFLERAKVRWSRQRSETT